MRSALLFCLAGLLILLCPVAHAQEFISSNGVGSKSFGVGDDPVLFLPLPGADLGPAGVIEFWVTPVWGPAWEQSGKPQCILSSGTEDSERLSIFLSPANYLGDPNRGFIALSSGGETKAVGADLAPGESYHIVLSSDGENTSVWMSENGQLFEDAAKPKGSIPELGFGRSNGAPWRLGALPDGSLPFEGEIGEIRLWNAPMTNRGDALRIDRTKAKQLATLLNRDLPRWRFDSKSGFGNLVAHSYYEEFSPRPFGMRSVDEITGAWVDPARAKPNDTHLIFKDTDFNLNGEYIAPGVVYFLPQQGGTGLVFRDGDYIGTFQKLGQEVYELRCQGATVELEYEYSGRTAPSLTAINVPTIIKKTFGLGDTSSNPTKLVLRRPQIEQSATDVTNTVQTMGNRDLDLIVKNYDFNFKSYNLRKMDPYDFKKTGVGDQFVFRKPTEYKQETLGRFVPSLLYLYKVDESRSEGSQITCSNSTDVNSVVASKTGVVQDHSAVIEVGLSLNESTERENEQMSRSESVRVESWSTFLDYALISQLPLQQLDDEFGEAIYDLAKDLDFVYFFENYGTHYPYAVTYGGMMSFTAELSKSGVANGLSNSSTNSRAIRFGMDSGDMLSEIGLQMKSKTELDQELSTGGKVRTEKDWGTIKTKLRIAGGEGVLMPVTETSNPEQATVGDDVIPVLLDLRPIYELLSPQFFDDPRIFVDLRAKMREKLDLYLIGADLSNGQVNDPTAELRLSDYDFWEFNLLETEVAKLGGGGGHVRGKLQLLGLPPDAFYLNKIGKFRPVNEATEQGGFVLFDNFDGDPITVLPGGSAPYSPNSDGDGGEASRFNLARSGASQNGKTFNDRFSLFMEEARKLKDSARPRHVTLEPFEPIDTRLILTPRASRWPQNRNEPLTVRLEMEFEADNGQKSQFRIPNGRYRGHYPNRLQFDSNEQIKERLNGKPNNGIRVWHSIRRVMSIEDVSMTTLRGKIAAFSRQPRPNIPVPPISMPQNQLLGDHDIHQIHLEDHWSFDRGPHDLTDPTGRPYQLLQSARLENQALVNSQAGASILARSSLTTPDLFSIHMDFWLDDAPNNHDILELRAEDGSYVVLRVFLNDGTPSVRHRVYAPGRRLHRNVRIAPISDRPLEFGKWHKLVVTVDGPNNQMATWLDGEKTEFEMERPVDASDRVQPIQESMVVTPFKGRLDDLMIFNRALSEDQAISLSQRPRP